MHKNCNFVLRPVMQRKTKVGEQVVCRAVDQTPTTSAFKNQFGLYDNDVTMLQRASDGGDKSLFDALASRLAMIDPERNDKTIQQLFDEWKPAYIQTASELQAWPAYLKQVQPDVYERLYGEEDRQFEAAQQQQKQVADKSDSQETA